MSLSESRRIGFVILGLFKSHGSFSTILLTSSVSSAKIAWYSSSALLSDIIPQPSVKSTVSITITVNSIRLIMLL